MNLSEELERLDGLRQRGVLSSAEFAQAKARLLDSPPGAAGSGQTPPLVSAVNGFHRSRQDRWVAGVCGGIARSSGVASWLWRLLFTLLVVFGGAGLVLYLLLWLFVPEE